MHKVHYTLLYLICNNAQNIPEFLDIVAESEFNVKYVPCPVQIIEAPKPIIADIKYNKNVVGHRNDTKNILYKIVIISTNKNLLQYKMKINNTNV